MSSAERATRAAETLEVLGIPECADRRLGELSGGQQQRVALGVALANRPRVLLADEPTGELDSRSSDEVFGAIRDANESFGTTVVVVTHDAHVSEQVSRTVGIRDGRTSSEVRRRTAVDEHGVEGVVAEEFAVLDRAGRLQLPRGFTDALVMRDRVRLDLEADHIGVWPTPRPDADGRRGGTGMTTDYLSVHEVHRTFRTGATEVHALRGVSLTRGARRARRRAGPLRVGQDDAAQRHRWPRPARRGPGRARRRRRHGDE